jgi:AraC-like DNA-binding protein
MDTDQPGATAAIPALLDLLLIYGVRAWYAQADVDTGWAAALRDPGITRALTAIQEHPGHPWTVESLAREAGKSRAVFARRFAELIGQPPLSYLTWCRMTAAATQLRDTPRPIAAVASRVGYTSEFAFSRAFRREFGIAPGAYRRDHVKEAAGHAEI